MLALRGGDTLVLGMLMSDLDVLAVGNTLTVDLTTLGLTGGIIIVAGDSEAAILERLKLAGVKNILKMPHP
jgi:hypothetical protein